MGEISEMMLDGTLCEACGCYVGDATGYPGYCSPQCARDRGQDFDCEPIDDEKSAAKPKVPKVVCPDCNKRVRITGISMHWNVMHRAKVFG